MVTNVTPVPDCHKESLFIAGPSGRLEALIECPEPGFPPRAAAVVCHPHPLHGGTMQNKVVHTLARTLNGMGVATLRFNFRGVGNSAGEYAEAVGETDDLHAVLAWVQQRWPGLPLWLGGFSFGAYVALRAAPGWPLQQLITIAPPVRHFTFAELPPIATNWLLVQGDEDEVVPSEEVLRWAESLAAPPRVLRMAGAGHFFHARLNELRQRIEAELGAP